MGRRVLNIDLEADDCLARVVVQHTPEVLKRWRKSKDITYEFTEKEGWYRVGGFLPIGGQTYRLLNIETIFARMDQLEEEEYF